MKKKETLDPRPTGSLALLTGKATMIEGVLHYMTYSILFPNVPDKAFLKDRNNIAIIDADSADAAKESK